MDKLRKMVFCIRGRLPLPIAVYPGIQITGNSIREVVTDANVQTAVTLALQQRYQTPVVLTAMDLSVEAEAFGAPVRIEDFEVPTVTEPIVSSLETVEKLPIPRVGSGRTGVYLQVVQNLRKENANLIILGCCTGPFSLAGRLAGLSEICMLAITDPPMVELLLEKCTAFLSQYVSAFKSAGANGVIIAEPAAGLLSPEMMENLSIKWINRITEKLPLDDFAVILHNCGAKPLHIPPKSKANVCGFHFGAPMDIISALHALPKDKLVCGNLDPSRIFVQSSPEDVYKETTRLLETCIDFPNFVPSSGCDIPHHAPLQNLDAFFEAVRSFNTRFQVTP